MRSYSIFSLAKLFTNEWLRLKFFQVVIFFGVAFLLLSHLLSTLTFSVQERILCDFGLAGLELGLMLTSILIGSHAVYREIERKTVFVILARPIPRFSIVIGLWLSLVFLNFIFFAGFGISFFISSDFPFSAKAILWPVLGSLCKSLIIGAFSIAIGVLVRPIMAMALAVVYWLLCFSFPDIRYFAEKMKSVEFINFLDFIDYLIPQFYRYNWKSYYYMNNPPVLSEGLWSLGHSVVWIAIWLMTAALVFKRKELV
jgi:ABC-type transport system involved in multi-copper enzyme maturation permease subunit